MAKKEMTFKENLKGFLIIMGVILTVSLIYTLWRNAQTNRLEDEYFKNVNFSFIGKVDGGYTFESNNESDRKLQPGAGPKFNTYYMQPLSSSIEEYDPRDSTFEFYCLIKKNRICIIERTTRKNIKGNDIIRFDGIKDSVYHYKIERRRKGSKTWYDTVLYAKWKPSNIFWEPHRINLAKELIKDFPR